MTKLNRRRTPRFASRLGAIMHRGKIAHMGRIRDISLGGFFFVCDAEVASGQLVRFEIALSGGQGSLMAMGWIRRRAPDGFGVQLYGLSPDDSFRWANAVHAIAPRCAAQATARV